MRKMRKMRKMRIVFACSKTLKFSRTRTASRALESTSGPMMMPMGGGNSSVRSSEGIAFCFHHIFGRLGSLGGLYSEDAMRKSRGKTGWALFSRRDAKELMSRGTT